MIPLDKQRQMGLSDLLSILSLKMEVVGGVHAPVHALLIPRDPALYSHSLGGGSENKLLQVIHIDGWLVGQWGGSRSRLLFE